jgi:hypothetical protein
MMAEFSGLDFLMRYVFISVDIRGRMIPLAQAVTLALSLRLGSASTLALTV